MFKAIDAALPKDTRPPDKRLETEDDIAKREELHIEGIECEFVPDIAAWQAGVQKILHACREAGRAAGRTRPPLAMQPLKPAPHRRRPTPASAALPQLRRRLRQRPLLPRQMPRPPHRPKAPPRQRNSGWIIELRGYHLHNWQRPCR